MHTIKRAAELTGISVATLRAWERRYGVVSPQRSDGGYRLYGPDDVRALAIMNSLVNEGWSAREAAAETLNRLASRDSGERSRSGTVSTLRPPGAGIQSEDAEALIRAAERLDSASASAVLDARFALGTFEHVIDDWLMPTLKRVGDEWANGRLTVAGEHLVAYAVQRRLAAAYEAASTRAEGPPLIIGLPPGARHELGLLAFAVAARRVGFSTAYVGADLPAEDWLRAISPTATVIEWPRCTQGPVISFCWLPPSPMTISGCAWATVSTISWAAVMSMSRGTAMTMPLARRASMARSQSSAGRSAPT